MFVIIVGGGKTGSHLAESLLAQGHEIRVIEGRNSVIERLREELPDRVIVVGDGSSPSTLENAEIDHADVLAAVTGEDESNSGDLHPGTIRIQCTSDHWQGKQP